MLFFLFFFCPIITNQKVNYIINASMLNQTLFDDDDDEEIEEDDDEIEADDDEES